MSKDGALWYNSGKDFSKLISHYLAIFVYNETADCASIQLNDHSTHISSSSLNIIMSQENRCFVEILMQPSYGSLLTNSHFFGNLF